MGTCSSQKKKINSRTLSQSQSFKTEPNHKSQVAFKTCQPSPVNIQKKLFSCPTEGNLITSRLRKPLSIVRIQNQLNFTSTNYNSPLLETAASKKYTLIGQHKSNTQIQIVQNNKTGKLVLIENVQKQKELNEKYIEWLQKVYLDHINIIKVIEIHQDRLNYQVVFENFEGAPLSDLIFGGAKVPKKQVSQICDQMFSILTYLHQKNIVHGNLTMRSFEYIQKDDKYLVKLVNLKGIIIKEEHNIEIIKLLPPECLYKQHIFTQERDVWTVGMIALILRQGEIPYNIPQNCLLPTMIVIMKDHKFDFSHKKDEQFRIFLEAALAKDPSMRSSAESIITLKFITTYRVKEITQQEIFLKNFLKNKPCCCYILQLILQFFAQEFSWIEFLQIQKLFSEGDTKMDGLLVQQEIKKLILSYFKVDNLGVKIDEIFTQLNLQSDDGINQTQFLSQAIDREKLITQENIETTFNIFSEGKSEIVLRGLKKSLQCEAVNLKKEFADLTNDYNTLNFEQYQKMMISLLN